MTEAERGIAPHRDPFFWGIVILGLALRGWMFASGRSPLDGDECVMGLMAHDLASFKHLPLYFYGQHYMGTIEIPLAAVLNLVGPASWDFSAWPIRLTEVAYLAALMWVHHRLCSRFFGTRIARWAVFFLAVGPTFWVDYSSRLRHVVFMMFMGEMLALTALGLIDGWRVEGRSKPRHVFVFGLLAGLAWWHYQLVLVYFAAVAVILAPHWRRLTGMFRSETGRVMPVNLIAILFMACGTTLIAGLTLGWGSKYWKEFPWVVASALLVGLPGVLLAFKEWRTGTASGHERAQPGLLIGSFLLGFLPSIIYLVTLREEFWVARVEVNLYDLPGRTRNLFLLDFAHILQFMRPSRTSPGMHELTPLAYCFFGVYAIAIYSFLRGFLSRNGPMDRQGRMYWTALFVALVALHVLTPRYTDFTEPRFLIPAFAVISVMLAFAAEEITGVFMISRLASAAVATALAAGAILMWMPGWRSANDQPMTWPAGHRKEAVDVARALERHGVKRIVLSQSANWILFGYELQFITRMKIRFNAGSMGDRLMGRLDEKQYEGPEYLLLLDYETAKWVNAPADATRDELAAAVVAAGGFTAERYYVIPKPLDYVVFGRALVRFGSEYRGGRF